MSSCPARAGSSWRPRLIPPTQLTVSPAQAFSSSKWKCIGPRRRTENEDENENSRKLRKLSMHRQNRTEVFTLGHSHDPDDAFMFYAMAKHKIDLHGYRFEHRLQDIQTLNERARRGELHISAISIHAYAYVAHKYALLPCGARMV